MFLLSLLAFLPKLIFGFSLAHLIWNDTRVSSIFLKGFLGIPLGMGVGSILIFFWKLAGLSHSGYVVFEISFVAITLAVTLILQKGFIKGIDFDISIKPLLENKMLLSGLILVIGISITNFMFTVLLHPHGNEDTWSNWNLLARFIYYSANLSDTFAYLSSSTFPGYPFMISLDVANGWIFLNSVTTRVPILVAGLFTFSIPGILFFSLVRIRGIQLASIATILVMGPWLAQFGSLLYADIPVAVYYLSTGALVSLYLQTDSLGLVRLAGFMAGFSAWTKNDGLPFVMITTLTILIISIQKKQKNVAISFFQGLATPMAAVGVYKIFFAAPGNIVANGNAMLDRLQDFSRFQVVLEFFASNIASFGYPPVGFIWILLALLLVGGINVGDRNSGYIAFILVLQGAVYFAVYLITPLDLKWHLASSGGRVIMHLIPLFIFVAFNYLRPSNPLAFQGELDNHALNH